MAPRPDLYPLKTPRHITFPSELQEYLEGTSKPEPTRNADAKGPSVPPPLAYIEFLKALSPAFGSPSEPASAVYPSWSANKQLPSPLSQPSTASTSSFRNETVPASNGQGHHPTATPRSAGETSQFRRLRMSASYLYSPRAMESPKSAHGVRSPYPPIERRVRYMDTPTSGSSRSITIQHIVTHTVTLKRVPSLHPPPKGKRRRGNQTQK
ncbi:hypothetical protein BJX61DRAFT_153568 [Aspergillus egyptiacus]|nr:hypothetical protein BJX61DRAFT_153568 [Aspergillus egyptiacus]